MPYETFDFGGRGPLMHIGVANGFPPPVYVPLAAALSKQVHTISILPRPLWTNPPAPDALQSWEVLADDLLTALGELQAGRIVAAGHSLGGITTLIAAARQPERFSALILLDPTLLPPSWMQAIDDGVAAGEPVRLPLAEQARNRRAQFANRDEAFAYWRRKPLFADWSDEALWHYVDGVTRYTQDAGLTLRWPPEWEAVIFETLWTRSWHNLTALPVDLPLLVLRGASSDTFSDEAFALFRERVPQAVSAEVSGGHLFPQTAPGETARHILSFLRSNGLVEG